VKRRWLRKKQPALASGSDLDAFASALGMRREPARVFGCRLPWNQTDRSFRERLADRLMRGPQR